METWRITEVEELKAITDVILARAIARAHNDNAVVLALHGNLGAGKTTFMQTLAAKLGVTETVTSPTFVIMKQYELEGQAFDVLIHIDAYRIETDEELLVLGFEKLLTLPRTLICIEWAKRVENLLPPLRFDLTFEIDGDARVITLTENT